MEEILAEKNSTYINILKENLNDKYTINDDIDYINTGTLKHNINIAKKFLTNNNIPFFVTSIQKSLKPKNDMPVKKISAKDIFVREKFSDNFNQSVFEIALTHYSILECFTHPKVQFSEEIYYKRHINNISLLLQQCFVLSYINRNNIFYNSMREYYTYQIFKNIVDNNNAIKKIKEEFTDKQLKNNTLSNPTGIKTLHVHLKNARINYINPDNLKYFQPILKFKTSYEAIHNFKDNSLFKCELSALQYGYLINGCPLIKKIILILRPTGINLLPHANIKMKANAVAKKALIKFVQCHIE